MRVALVFGGASVEHEVSVVSARGVAAALDPKRFECVPLGVTGDGRWLTPSVSSPILRSGARRVEPGNPDDGSRVLADPGGGGFLEVAPGAGVRRIEVDAVFSVVHGWGGEDGRFQGLLDLAGIPYVGAGVLGSAVGMDKAVAKAVLERRGVPVGPWTTARRDEWRRDRGPVERSLAAEVGFPMFVKPANGGSSIGITKVGSERTLGEALEEAFSYDAKAVIERGLDVREIECAVLGNESAEASVLGEIVPSGEFYDYESKYLDASSELRIPAPLSPRSATAIRQVAVDAFHALDLCGLARVDFFVDRADDRRFWLNEVNTLPGFTPISMYPKLWEASGVGYSDLLARLLELGIRRFEEQRGRRSRWRGSAGRE